MADKDIYNTIVGRVETARRFYKNKAEDRFKTFLEQYKGNGEWLNSRYGKDSIGVNYTLSSIQIILASVKLKNVKFHAKAKTRQGEDAVIPGEAIVNYSWNEYRVINEIKSALLDWQIFGYGAVFTGWKAITGKEETEEGDVISSIELDQPDIRRIDPNNLWFSPESTNKNDIPYIVIRSFEPLAEVKGNKNYSGSARDEVKGNSCVDAKYMEEKGPDYDNKDLKRVEVFHYYGKNGDYYAYTPEVKDKFLFKGKSPYKYNELPVELIFNYSVPGTIYPLSTPEIIMKQNQELDLTRTQMINHRKRYSRKYLYDADRLKEDDEVKKIEEGDDGAMIGVQAAGADLRSLMIPIQDPPLSPDVYNIGKEIKDDMNIILGIPDYARGGGLGAKSATEAAIMDKHSQRRSDDAKEEVRDFLQRVGKRLYQLNQQYLTDSKAVKIVGADNQQYWLEIDKTMIAEELDIDLNPEQITPEDDMIRNEQIMRLYNLTYGKPETDPVELTRTLVESFPQFRTNVDKIVVKHGLMSELAQKENQLMLLGQPVPPTKGASLEHTQEHLRLLDIETEKDQRGEPTDRQITRAEVMAFLNQHARGEVSERQSKQGPVSPALMKQGTPTKEGMLRSAERRA